ncbi:MAG: HNH endonuclease [Pyrinomonadaceae bacterium]
MIELDFYTFGAPRNKKFLRRIKTVLDKLDSAEERLYRRSNDYRFMVVALDFLGFYYRARSISSAVRNFFQCTGFKNHLKAALAVRADIESRAASPICLAVMDVFREYETFAFQWEKTREHMALQRAIMNRQRKKFYAAVVARDGGFCAKCHTTEKLELDHIKSVLFGGYSVLDNLQLLCAKCNNKKRFLNEDYRTKNTPAPIRKSNPPT